MPKASMDAPPRLATDITGRTRLYILIKLWQTLTSI
jgi:hypothetical protein